MICLVAVSFLGVVAAMFSSHTQLVEKSSQDLRITPSPGQNQTSYLSLQI
jgi:hypothetical protein